MSTPASQETPRGAWALLSAAMSRETSSYVFGVYRLLVIAVLFVYTTKFMVAIHQPLPYERIWLATLMTVASWTAFVGLYTRTSVYIVTACFAYFTFEFGATERARFMLQDVQMLQALCLLVLCPSGRSLSLDRWLAVRRAERTGAELPGQRGPGFAQWVGVACLSIMYVWTAVECTQSPWLSGFTIEQIWVGRWGSSGSLASFGDLAHPLSVGLAWLALAVVTILAIGLWIPRLRWPMVGLALALHAVVWVLAGSWPFTISVVVMHAIVLPADDVRRFFETVFDLELRAAPVADGSS